MNLITKFKKYFLPKLYEKERRAKLTDRERLQEDIETVLQLIPYVEKHMRTIDPYGDIPGEFHDHDTL